MTAMKNGASALIAAIIGILLIGVLPTQLSEVPSLTTQDKADAAAAPTDNSSFSVTGNGAKNPIPRQASPLDQIAMDLPYYSLWAVNLAIALGIYLIARHRS